MAWATTYRLGCAVVTCPEYTYGVCQYGPAGNRLNSKIYITGEPCSRCPKLFTCSEEEGLCNVVRRAH
ncbi:unnamed protein product [Strongylus vulgaris]|uniref:SCP domain-containing protein n=1 Tax=Strongylus vulgaris TaxID=40348 RepID=A0A3P7JGL2_STRVU|nr:unnamed protein product [Strongylus vulgaris]